MEEKKYFIKRLSPSPRNKIQLSLDKRKSFKFKINYYSPFNKFNLLPSRINKLLLESSSIKKKIFTKNESSSLLIKDLNLKKGSSSNKNSESPKSPKNIKNPILKIQKELINSKYASKDQITDFGFTKLDKYCNHSNLNLYNNNSNKKITNSFSPKNCCILPQLDLTSTQFKQKYFIDVKKEKEKLQSIISDIELKEKILLDKNESKMKKRQSILSQMEEKDHDSKIIEFQLSNKIIKSPSTTYLKSESPKEYTLSSELKNETSEVEMYSRENISSPKKNKYESYKRTTANINQQNENHKKRRFEKKYYKLLFTLRSFKKLNINSDFVRSCKIFPSIPFERKYSKDFLHSVKYGYINKVDYYCSKYPLLVYGFDQMYRTGLHWAVKRGNLEMMKLLLDRKSNPDSQDQAKRTPLHFAAKKNSLNAIKMLLSYGANPLYLTHGNYSCYHFATDRFIKEELKHAMYVYVYSKLVPYKYKDKYLEIFGYDHWGNFKTYNENDEDSNCS